MSTAPHRIFLDTAVFAYALGGTHTLREPCRAILAAAARSEVELHASVEMVQELIHHRLRRTDRFAAVSEARTVAEACVLHAFDAGVMTRALDLIADTALNGRDAVHAGTAAVHGFTAIVSPDRDFDSIPGLRRISPEQALA